MTTLYIKGDGAAELGLMQGDQVVLRVSGEVLLTEEGEEHIVELEVVEMEVEGDAESVDEAYRRANREHGVRLDPYPG